MEDLLKKRASIRSKITKTTGEFKDYRMSSEVQEDDLAYKIHMLEKLESDLLSLQNELTKLGCADESNHLDRLEEEIFKGRRMLTRLESSHSATQAGRDFGQLDLSSPLVKLPSFDGSISGWPEFWELFDITVNRNPKYTDVQRFVILKAHLGALAKPIIEGIPLSDDGYVTALDLLQKRFAKKDQRQEILLKQLMEIPPVKESNDLVKMRGLIDRVTARVRGLTTLGVSTDSFSTLLLPLLKEKLPEAWRLEWARQPVHSFSSFLEFLQREADVRELAAPARPVLSSPRPLEGCATVSGLSASRQQSVPRGQGHDVRGSAAQSRGDWLCVACGIAKHGLAACPVYRSQDVCARWEMVRAAGVCFRCLGPHYARDCHSSNCLTCGAPHHTSLHSSTEPELPPGAGARDRRPPPQRTGSSGQPPTHLGSSQPGLQPSPASRQPQRSGWSPAATRQTMNVTADEASELSPPVESPPCAQSVVSPPSEPHPSGELLSPTTASVNTACALPEHVRRSPPASEHCSPHDSPGTEPAPCVHLAASDGVCYMQTALVEATGPRGTCYLRVLLDGGSDSSYVRASAADLLGLPTVGSGTFACLGFQERLEEPRKYDKVSLSVRSRHGGEALVLDLWKSERLCSQLTPSRAPAVVFAPHLLLADDFEGGPVDVLIGADLMYRIVLWDQVRLTDHLRALETVFGYVLHGRDQSPTCLPVKYALRCSRLQTEEVSPEQLWSLEALGITEEEETRPLVKPRWSVTDQRYEVNLLWKSADRPVTNFSSAAARTRRMESRLSPSEHEEYGQHLAQLQRSCVVEAPPAGEEGGFFLPHRGIWRNGKLRVVYDGSAKDAVGRSLNDYIDAGENLLRRLPAVLINFRRDSVAAQADIRAAFHQVSVAEEDRKFLQFLWEGQCLRFRRVPFGISCSPYLLLQTIFTHLGRYHASDPLLCQKLEAGLYMDDVCTSFPSRADAAAGMQRTEKMFADAGMELHKLRISGDDSGEETHVLGLRWCTSADRLAVCVPPLPTITTKRQLLSTLCKPHDPLGLLSPWLVTGRALFQRTWAAPSPPSWDEVLPPDLQREFAAWCSGASDRAVWFPRAAQISAEADVTYHVFCDASKVAYCCAIYVACGCDVRLLIAKSRLAPVASVLSIPRLELMAALISSRLMDFVRRSLDLTDVRVVYWTDAMDVLYWLDQRRALKVFVQNRVSSILQLTSRDQWRHVRGPDNPADLGTRGLTMSELISCDLWWCGPDFLRAAAAGPLPVLPAAGDDLPLSPEAAVELKREAAPTRVSLLTSQGEKPAPFDVKACSRLSQAVDRLAWVRRFVSNCRLPRGERVVGPLSLEERRWSLAYWIRDAQLCTYPKEIQAVRADQLLPPGSSLAKLRPQLGDDGLLEAALRTGEPPVPILPDRCHITALIVDDAHRRCFHQGTRVTLAQLSAEYAVKRLTVRRTVDACRRCKRYRGLPYRSPEGALPSFRTQPSRPFSKVGVDYFGPLFVNNSATKVWVLLITCASSRAVHLELVHSQATAELVLALRRFYALRGTPVLIYSDNARTFHALIGHLPRCVTWRFIPEAAPWWGGWWERMVGVTKAALRSTLHLCHLSYEELCHALRACVLYQSASAHPG